MSIIGEPRDWIDLIGPLVPDILRLVVASWEEMDAPAGDDREDEISIGMCRVLRQNRTARELPFQIDTQQVELDPAAGEDMGRLDISFRPLVAREDIYFCLECKRLNVVHEGHVRSYASEYVASGVTRFVSGQYASRVRHGGMLGYVLDGNVPQAIANVENNLRERQVDLGMEPPGEFVPSTVLPEDERAKETRHRRGLHTEQFLLHHLFMAGKQAATATAPRVRRQHRAVRQKQRADAKR